MRILINTPNWKHPELGGVANHFYGLKPYWKENVRYNIVGSRKIPNTGKYWLPWDLIKTIFKLLFYRPEVVMVNTSLGKNALKRDSIFLNIAHYFGAKTIVHFHGFNVNYACEIDTKWFISLFKHASGFLVLSNSIKHQLQEWGVKQPILLTTTKVDDRLVKDYDVSNRRKACKQILYLGRVEKEKGIYLSLDIYVLLQKIKPDLMFTVVGGGSELENAKKYAEEKGITNITFTGVLKGNSLRKQYEESDLYLFTSFHEGMPTSVLEAMCFGLPIVTRPVGGLVDFFEQEKMGYMVNSFNANDFIQPIKNIIESEDNRNNYSVYNYNYGNNHFLASKVAISIEKNIKELC